MLLRTPATAAVLPRFTDDALARVFSFLDAGSVPPLQALHAVIAAVGERARVELAKVAPSLMLLVSACVVRDAAAGDALVPWQCLQLLLLLLLWWWCGWS
jgi:hypothetical protein